MLLRIVVAACQLLLISVPAAGVAAHRLAEVKARRAAAAAEKAEADAADAAKAAPQPEPEEAAAGGKKKKSSKKGKEPRPEIPRE